VVKSDVDKAVDQTKEIKKDRNKEDKKEVSVFSGGDTAQGGIAMSPGMSLSHIDAVIIKRRVLVQIKA
jgi:hypothetical protein